MIFQTGRQLLGNHMNTKSSGPGPDFLCIGQQKAGTGWLYDQLQAHEDVWMPPIKELKFFNGDPFRAKHLSWLRDYQAERGGFFSDPLWHLNRLFHNKNARESTRKLESRFPDLDRRFWAIYAAAAAKRSRDAAWYLSVFNLPEKIASGDISPNYSTATAEEIARAKSTVPEAKIILLIRDPVSRAKSAISMAMRRGSFDENRVNDWQTVLDFLNMPSVIARSHATKTWESWNAAFGDAQCRYWLMDDIIRKPVETRDAILNFLNLDPARAELPASHNRKASRKKAVFTAETEARLGEYFKDEIRACQNLFGGAAMGW